MRNSCNTKIKIGQEWRNKEKGYIIKIISKGKKGVWQTSAHGKRQTHGMTEGSFHFYELVQKDNDLKKLSKEEKVIITNDIRKVFNTNISKGHMFSINDLTNFLIKEEGKEKEQVKNRISSFIHECVKKNIVTKHSNKIKVSSSKKVYQKLGNSIINHRFKGEDLDIGININWKLFKTKFNLLEINQKFQIDDIVRMSLETLGKKKLEEEKKKKIKMRISSFITRFIKKGYIKRDIESKCLIKIKHIDDGTVPIPMPLSQEVEEKPIEVTKSIEIEEESKLERLIKQFGDSNLSELVETFIMYFNILQEKDKNNEEIINELQIKNKKLQEKNNQLNCDVDDQLDENEKLQQKYDVLKNKLLESNSNNVWKQPKISDVINLRC